MNALQQRMMANAMAHGEMAGMGLGPVPASQRAMQVKYEDRLIPEIGYHTPGAVLLGKVHPSKKKMKPEAKAAWVAANPEQAQLLEAAHGQRAVYAAFRASGDFSQVANAKALARAQKKAIRASPDYRPQPLSAALQKAHENKAHNTYMRDALGKAVADKYRRAADAALKAGTNEVIVDGILLVDPFDSAAIFAHRQKVIAAKAAAKAAKVPRGSRPLSQKPAAVAARARTAIIKEALAKAGVVIPKAPRAQKKSEAIVVAPAPGAVVAPRPRAAPAQQRTTVSQAAGEPTEEKYGPPPTTYAEREALDARIRGQKQHRWNPYPDETRFPDRTYSGERRAYDYANRKYYPISQRDG